MYTPLVPKPIIMQRMINYAKLHAQHSHTNAHFVFTHLSREIEPRFQTNKNPFKRICEHGKQMVKKMA